MNRQFLDLGVKNVDISLVLQVLAKKKVLWPLNGGATEHRLAATATFLGCETRIFMFSKFQFLVF